MKFLNSWRHVLTGKSNALGNREALLKEIEKAKLDWLAAQNKLDFVTDQDQIDYAIYALEAAEKRYEMLLKIAKRMNLHALEDR